MLYGGSVTEKNIQELKKSPLIDGFLVGKSSLDFQELKKIVSLEIV
jgi:triosephosphate isomerase